MIKLTMTDDFGNENTFEVELRTGEGQSTCKLCGKRNWDSFCWKTSEYSVLCDDCMANLKKKFWTDGVIKYRKDRGDFR